MAQRKKNGVTAYEKDVFYNQHKDRILKLAANKSALERLSSASPKTKTYKLYLHLPRKSFKVKQITIDDIDSFSRVKGVRAGQNLTPVDEIAFKSGIQRIIGEEGVFQDWGGEPNDLFTTRLLYNGKRMPAAFGFKGKGTQGILYPKKMGKRGDQIQRLIRSPASVFIVQYWGQIDDSILDQLERFSIAKSSVEGKEILYGIVDGQDTERIISAYPEAFEALGNNPPPQQN